jgi:hypothetical protein
MTGKIFLPAANLWSQLLSFHGIVFVYDFSFNFWMTKLYFLTSSSAFTAANLSQGSETGKHTTGWKSNPKT